MGKVLSHQADQKRSTEGGAEERRQTRLNGQVEHVRRALCAILRGLYSHQSDKESGGSFEAGDWRDQIHFRNITLAEA